MKNKLYTITGFDIMGAEILYTFNKWEGVICLLNDKDNFLKYPFTITVYKTCFSIGDKSKYKKEIDLTVLDYCETAPLITAKQN